MVVYVAGADGEPLGSEVYVDETAHSCIFGTGTIDLPLLCRIGDSRREGEIPVYFLSDFCQEIREACRRHRRDGVALGALNSLLSLSLEASAAGRPVKFEPAGTRGGELGAKVQ